MQQNNLSIIVAIAENFAIGYKNDLLVHIPGDLARFKTITSGHTVIMGRNTLKSLPKWPLPNRRNIVISDIPNENFEGCDMATSIPEAIEMAKTDDEAFIIGGGMIYKQFYPIASKLYVTVVHKTFTADTFFPEIDWSEWEMIDSEHFDAGEKADFAFSYLTFTRK